MTKKYTARYNSGDGIVEIIVRNETGGKEAMFRVNQRDKAQHAKIGAFLKLKYDVDFSPNGDGEKSLFDF